jgi:hypothetical protein
LPKGTSIAGAVQEIAQSGREKVVVRPYDVVTGGMLVSTPAEDILEFEDLFNKSS